MMKDTKTSGSEGSSPEVLPDPTTLALLSVWIEEPLDKVGALENGISGYPTGGDWLGKRGCRQQSYTLWDASSRSYVASFQVAAEASRARQRRAAQIPEKVGDNPTESELDALDGPRRMAIQKGKAIFLRGTSSSDVLYLSDSNTEWYRQKVQAWRRLRFPDSEEQRAPSGDSEEGDDEGAVGGVSTDGELLPLPAGAVGQLPPLFEQPQRQKRSPPDLVTNPRDMATANKLLKDLRTAYSELTNSYARVSTARSTLLGDIDQLNKRIADSDSNRQQAEELSKRVSELTNKVRELESQLGDFETQARDMAAQKASLNKQLQEQIMINRRQAGLADPAVDRKPYTPTHCSKIPVYCVKTYTWQTEMDTRMKIPYSAVYTAYANRVSQADATALGAILRGPSIRDAASVLAYVRFLSSSTYTVREEAPLVRAGCIAVSLDPMLFFTEPVVFRLLRPFTRSPALPLRITRITKTTGRVMAVPLDQFTAYSTNKISLCNDENNPFQWADVDSNWVAVPVRSEITSHPWFLAYIMCFLTSEYWNGSINHFVAGNIPQDGQNRRVVYTLMPATNSVYIPGATNVMLVILDSTGSYPSAPLSINGVQIPTYINAPIASGDLAAIWNLYFVTDNASRIASDFTSAFLEIQSRLGVERSAMSALSVVSELHARNYSGIYIPTEDNGTAYRMDRAQGGWSLARRQLTAGGPRLDAFPQGAGGTRPLMGYAFSGLSAWGRPPGGCADLHTYDPPADSDDGAYATVWTATRPDYFTYTHHVATLQSFLRVAVALKLVVTYEHNLNFSSCRALSAWIHMNSVAMTSLTSSLIAQSNIELSLWTGHHVPSEFTGGATLMEKYVALATNSRATWFNFIDFFAPVLPVNEYIEGFFGVDIEGSNWLSYFPTPFPLTLMWEAKIDKHAGREPEQSHLYIDNVMRRTTELTGQSLDYRWRSVCTPQLSNYQPVAVYRSATGACESLGVWVDQYAHITIKASGSGLATKPEDLCSSLFVKSPIDNSLPRANILTLHVINSSYAYVDSEEREFRHSKLLWPDPISWESILQGAKNYLLNPALAGLAGYTTGGPVGAAVGGGGAFLAQLLKDISGSSAKEAADIAKQVATEVQRNISTTASQQSPASPTLPAARGPSPVDARNRPASPQHASQVPNPLPEHLVLPEPSVPLDPVTPETLTQGLDASV